MTPPAGSRGAGRASHIAAQQTDSAGGCSVEGAGIVDVFDMANTMANRADRVAACKVPPALTSE
jgi:hypothetical protein